VQLLPEGYVVFPFEIARIHCRLGGVDGFHRLRVRRIGQRINPNGAERFHRSGNVPIHWQRTHGHQHFVGKRVRSLRRSDFEHEGEKRAVGRAD